MQKYCTKCGSEMSQDGKFCGSCGSEIENINTDNKKIKGNENIIEKFLIIAIMLLSIGLLILPIFFY